MKKEMLKALKNKYAIGPFNFVNLEKIKAIIEASLQTNFPVICSVSEGAIKYIGEQETIAMFNACIKMQKHIYI